jgi:hypothetical protein
MILLLVRPDGALTARAMEPARHGSLRRELTSALCAPPAQNTVLEASAIPRPTTMTAHAGEPSHYYKYKNVWALSRSCSTLGAEHQGLTLSEGSGDRACAGATSVGCSSSWLSCPWDKQTLLDGAGSVLGDSGEWRHRGHAERRVRRSCGGSDSGDVRFARRAQNGNGRARFGPSEKCPCSPVIRRTPIFLTMSRLAWSDRTFRSAGSLPATGESR